MMPPEERLALLEKIAASAIATRSHQQTYFSNRTSSSLVAAKDQERQLDALLDQYFRAGEGPQPIQQNLFS